MVIDTDVVHRFSLVEILTLCDALALQTMPTVLRIEETPDDGLTAQSRDDARAALEARDVIDDAGNVDLHVRSILIAAAVADWIVEMRRVDVTQILRVCIVASADRRFLLSRNGDAFAVREVVAGDDARLVRSEIVALIGEAPGADVPELRVPSDVLDTTLRSCADETDYAAAFFALGQPEPAARRLAATLVDCVGQTEIVARADDAAQRSVIAVFDTARGRVLSVATPSVSGERWTSIGAGDGARVASALRQLAHTLPGGV
ncbi:ESX secretion-associated protein EspG [Williamsia deligens]|uniref:ESX secretion-associated protein EspG n=1 Tax=Williamsia deligens TaxID=321325 RepID=A0ABW3G6D1_9NOCA|nr:ESX secretion-associated protein EspG [Williamsia deligens]MCP2192968.1 EspG family protein [Williamsia deligens]